MGKKAQRISFSSDISFDLIHSNFLQYVLGAVTLAIVRSATTALIDALHRDDTMAVVAFEPLTIESAKAMPAAPAPMIR